MYNTTSDPISLGPAAQSLSLPARRMLLAQYADKAQSGHLYSDPQWASWGATMRRRGMIDHPALGKAPAGPSPTLDDLMFRMARGQGASYKPRTNDMVYYGPPAGTPDWKHHSLQLTDYKTHGGLPGKAKRPQTPSTGGLNQLKPLAYPKTNYALNPSAIEKAKNTVPPNHGKRPLTPRERAHLAALEHNLNQFHPQGPRPFLHLDPNFGVVHGHDLLRGSKNFFAGWGDTLTDGATKYARKYLGQLLAGGDANTEVDYNSLGYHGGEAVGTAQQMLMGGAGGLKVAGKAAAKEIAERDALNKLKRVAVKLKMPEPVRKDVKEFSHFIPNRKIKEWIERTSDPRLKKLIKKFGDSNWNGRYVSPKQHHMHDVFRNLAGTGKHLKPGVEPININKLPIGIQQIDRTPTVYRGATAGATSGIGHHFGGRERRK